MVNKFEDLKVWQLSQKLAIYIISQLKDSTNYAFINQITRASISISSNIAEGFDRNSKKEFIHFLYISRGSNSEVKSLLYLAKELSWIENNVFDSAMDYCNQIGKMLNGLIGSIKGKVPNH